MITNLADLLNNSTCNFYFLVVDKFLDIDIPQLKNFYKIYLSDYPSIKIKNSGKLLSNPQVIKFIQQNSKKNNHIPAIIPFKPSAKIEFLCKKYNWINISNPSTINRLLEDKIKFVEICKQNKLQIIPSIIDNFNERNFLKYQQKFGKDIVIQTHFGWAGKSTFTSDNYSKLSTKITPEIKVKFSPLLSGYTLTNNCCLTSKGLIQSPPALQYTGIKPFTNNPFTTVGRQWPSFAPPKIQEQISEITQKFGEILKQLKYKGYFGLDFFINSDKIYILECNPRLTASFAFYNQIELKQNITPLFFFHIAEFLNLNYQINLKNEQQRFYNQQIIGSELTLKNKNSETIKKINKFKVFSTSINPVIIDPKIVKLF